MTALSEKLNFNVIVHQVGAPIMQQEFNPPMGSVPTLHLSYHLGQHYNSIRSLADPCNGPALNCPIGHILKIDGQPEIPTIESNVESVNLDLISVAL